MPKICYINKNFRTKSLEIIRNSNKIIEEYRAEGYTLTLRQLFYQHVSRDLISNTQKSYSNLGSIINDGRLAGLIDWEAIEDRTRNLHRLSTWGSPSDIVDSAARSYRTDKWNSQSHRIEVWIEKEALAGVFERVCDELEIPFFACRGYTSQSEMWAAAQRLIRFEKARFKTVILHFGDHDPSGVDMTRDIIDRLKMFGSTVRLHRMALNMDQIQLYNPPPNPAKATDARYQSYQEEFGEESWELDALEPQVLAQLVRDAVLELRDNDDWDDRMRQQENERKQLTSIADSWSEVIDILNDAGLV